MKIHTIDFITVCRYNEGKSDLLRAILREREAGRMNGVPVCTGYDDLRCCKLKEPLYPSGILAAAIVSGSDAPKTKALQEAIPEFLRFNIVESEVRNVV